MQAHLEHVGEVESDALEQHAVRQKFGTLPGSYVRVALTHQSPHLFQRCTCVDIITQSLMYAFFFLIETRHKHETCCLSLESEHIQKSKACRNNCLKKCIRNSGTFTVSKLGRMLTFCSGRSPPPPISQIDL